MAMQAGLAKLPIPKSQIHRMPAEEKIQDNALAYEKEIAATLNGRPFDLVMLGMGEDGHTASLFPNTEALKVQNRIAVANYLPDKKIWRMTLTYECINQARHITIYVLGTSKKDTLAKVLLSPPQYDHYPVQKVGTPSNHALWVIDEAAASEFLMQKEKGK
jgi:6-phosphogluconolactonase